MERQDLSQLIAKAVKRGAPNWTEAAANTVAQAAAPPLEPTDPPIFIASLRLVIEVGNWDAARYVLPGGQSGNPVSPHYDDQFALWQRGEGVPIPWSEAAVTAATRATLLLRPGPLIAGEPD